MIHHIKICGITTHEALLAAAEAGATMVGFVFTESPRRVPADHAATLAHAAPRGLARVAVFRHPSPSLVSDVITRVPIDLVQSDAGDFPAIKDALHGTPFLPVYRDGEGLTASVAAGEAAGLNGDRVLIEGPKSGSGLTPDWGRIAALGNRRVILAGGLCPGNIARAIDAVRPVGVDASSGVEHSPGVKDPALIRAFVHAARGAFERLDPQGAKR
jgi:phosphoribosylanthranilate isomerase